MIDEGEINRSQGAPGRQAPRADFAVETLHRPPAAQATASYKLTGAGYGCSSGSGARRLAT